MRHDMRWMICAVSWLPHLIDFLLVKVPHCSTSWAFCWADELRNGHLPHSAQLTSSLGRWLLFKKETGCKNSVYSINKSKYKKHIMLSSDEKGETHSFDFCKHELKSHQEYLTNTLLNIFQTRRLVSLLQTSLNPTCWVINMHTAYGRFSPRVLFKHHLASMKW